MTMTGHAAADADTLSDLLQARYGDAGRAPSAASVDAVIAPLLSHRSVRAYLPDALPPQTLPTLMAAAQSAASSSNLQTWSVVAVRDAARKQRLSAMAGHQAHIVEAPLLLVFLADLSRIRRIAGHLDRPVEGLDHLDTFLMGVIDAALAAQNAVVAAEAMGLGTVYIGGMRNQPEQVAAELALPPGTFAVFGLVVGRPDPARPARVKPRLSPAVVLHEETYRVPATLEDEVLDYDRVLQAFQQTESMPGFDWTDTVTRRMRGPEQLTGRHRLVEALGNAGFVLR